MENIGNNKKSSYTYFVTEVENRNGLSFSCNRYFNSEEDYSYNSLITACRTQLTDEECKIETEKSWDAMQKGIEEAGN